MRVASPHHTCGPGYCWKLLVFFRSTSRCHQRVPALQGLSESALQFESAPCHAPSHLDSLHPLLLWQVSSWSPGPQSFSGCHIWTLGLQQLRWDITPYSSLCIACTHALSSYWKILSKGTLGLFNFTFPPDMEESLLLICLPANTCCGVFLILIILIDM